ncbi:MAG: hypothetical protein D6820_07395, partial [Lentisphaerae bacterium]
MKKRSTDTCPSWVVIMTGTLITLLTLEFILLTCGPIPAKVSQNTLYPGSPSLPSSLGTSLFWQWSRKQGKTVTYANISSEFDNFDPKQSIMIIPWTSLCFIIPYWKDIKDFELAKCVQSLTGFIRNTQPFLIDYSGGRWKRKIEIADTALEKIDKFARNGGRVVLFFAPHYLENEEFYRSFYQSGRKEQLLSDYNIPGLYRSSGEEQKTRIFPAVWQSGSFSFNQPQDSHDQGSCDPAVFLKHLGFYLTWDERRYAFIPRSEYRKLDWKVYCSKSQKNLKDDLAAISRGENNKMRLLRPKQA